MRRPLPLWWLLTFFVASYPVAPSLAANTAAPLTAFTVPVVPWTFPDQPTRGIAPEYMRYLFDAAHIDVHLDTLPYLRVINGLRDGSNAAAMLIPDAERDTFAMRLCEVATIHSGLVYKKSRFNSLDLHALEGMSVGVQRGTHALDELKSKPKLKLHLIDSIDQGLKMLEVDRLDATFLSSPGSDSVLQSHGLTRADYGWVEIEASPVVIYPSRKSPLMQDAAALQRLKNVCEGSGRTVMQRLMERYR